LPYSYIAEPQWERSENAVSTVKIQRAKGAIALMAEDTGRASF